MKYIVARRAYEYNDEVYSSVGEGVEIPYDSKLIDTEKEAVELMYEYTRKLLLSEGLHDYTYEIPQELVDYVLSINGKWDGYELTMPDDLTIDQTKQILFYWVQHESSFYDVIKIKESHE